ncbi:MAG: hypothetical protein ACYC96_00085 [Fimbriimonadaceae bacterium]
MNSARQLCSGLLALAAFALCSGCDSKAPGANFASKPPASVQPTPADPQKPTPPPPKVDLDRTKLPVNLQTDAYRYYGLSCTKPLDMEVTSTSPAVGILTGSMSARMTQVDKSGATFAVETTGTLNDRFGNETVALKPDGIYIVSSDKEQLSKPQLDLPTGFSTGKPWTVDATVGSDEGKLRQKVTSACKGARTVKIGDTTYPALYVVGEGTYSGPALSAHVVTRQWFVKDIGVVRMELVQTPKGKPPVTIKMVWKPDASKAKA